MALDVSMTAPGSIGPLRPGWTINQDVSPISIGDSSGSVGSAELVAARTSDSEFVGNNTVVLTHDSLGPFHGRVTSVSLRGQSAGLSVFGWPEFLNAVVTAPAQGLISFGGDPITLSVVFQAYVDLAVEGRTVTWEASSDPEVMFRGWRDRLWVKLKELAAAYGVEFAPVGDELVVRDVGSVILDLKNNTPVEFTPMFGSGAQRLDIWYQDAEIGSRLYTADRIYKCDVGTIETVVVQTTNYTSNEINPEPSDTPQTYGFSGGYYVEDDTGSHVPAVTWEYYGGGVTVSADELGRLDITFVGPRTNIPGFTGPFSFSSTVGGVKVPDLVIESVAALLTSPKKLELLTGADPATSPQLLSQTINNPFINTLEQAYDRGAWAVPDASGVGVRIRFDMPIADLLGFGLDVGSLVTYNENIFRITNVNYGNVGASLTGVLHATGDDVHALFTGWSNDDMASLWSGFTNDDTRIKPLRGERTSWLFPSTGLYPATDLYPGPQ